MRRILDAVADEVRSRGLVGEERLAQTLYLVFTSRLLDKQVSAGVKGHSASGKSYTVETVTRFFPPEAYLEFTAMSERALVYSTEEYAHRTLVVYEVTALREGVEDDMTSYFVRSLLSEGRIVYPVTVRDKDGGFTTKKIIKEGPTNLDLHDDQDAGSRGERDPHPVAGHRRLTRADRAGAARTRRRKQQ